MVRIKVTGGSGAIEDPFGAKPVAAPGASKVPSAPVTPRWTPEEDDKLRALVTEHGDQSWEVVAAQVANGRSVSAVEQHYNFLVGKRKSIENKEAAAKAKAERKAERERKAKMPKGAKSCYILYCEEVRAAITTQHSELGMTEIAKLLGESWQTLSEEEKVKYSAAASADKERYEREMIEGGFATEPVIKKRKRKTKAQSPDAIAWYVPTGFTVQSEAPSSEELTFGNAAGDTLVGRHLLFNWQGVGWCEGVVKQRNTNKRQSLDGDPVNFLVHYQLDDNTSKHNLEAENYAFGVGAEVDSWVMLNKVNGGPLREKVEPVSAGAVEPLD